MNRAPKNGEINSNKNTSNKCLNFITCVFFDNIEFDCSQPEVIVVVRKMSKNSPKRL